MVQAENDLRATGAAGLRAAGAHGSPSAHLNERAPKLVLELFKDILISLPTRECFTIEKDSSEPHSRSFTDGQLCFVDWSQTKMTSERGGETSNFIAADRELRPDQLEGANLYLDESSFAHQRIDSGHQMIEHSGGPQALVRDLLRLLASSSSNKAHYRSNISPLNGALDETNQQLSRLTYLSAGSLLSLVGIITNLLILLIIFINTKQKCHNILGRGQTSHTNYHHVLLFQLTLTGLLLGGHILIDNINLYNGLNSSNSSDCNSDLQASARGAYPFSPLSIYLPPTPFHVEATHRAGGDNLATSHEDQDELLPRKHHRPLDVSEISAFVVYLEARRHQRSGRTRDRLHRVGPASLVLLSCRASDEPRSQRLSHQEKPPAQEEFEDLSESPPAVSSTNTLFNLIAAIHLWTAAALAYDRYCAIAHPLEYLRSINDTKARTFLVVLWCAALLTNVLLPVALEDTLAPGSRPSAVRQSIISRFEITGRQLERNFHEARAQELYVCSAQAAAPGMDKRQDADPLEFAQFLIGHLTSQAPSDLHSTRRLHAYLAIGLSLLTFLLVILAPLVVITICNVSIYGIVKVHERRISVSSSSQGGGFVGVGSSASSGLSQGRCMKRDSLLTNNTDLAQERSETCSIASSILGKLIRASVQVGAMGGILINSSSAGSSSSSSSSSISREETSSQCSASSNEQEICQLISSGRDESRRPAEPEADMANSSRVRANVPASEPSLSGSSCFVSRRRLVSMRRQQQQKQQQQRHFQPSLQNGAHQASSKSRSVAREAIFRKKLKRKLSDKEPAAVSSSANSQSRPCSRKSSLAPSEQTLTMQESAYCPLRGGTDNCSCHSNQFTGTPTRQSLQQQQQQQQLQTDSDGIMRQLKMAGLSFAGIAISELMSTPAERSRTLQRSSSWSLGNMSSLTNNRQQEQQQQHSNGCIGVKGSAANSTHSGTAATSQSCQATSRCLGLNNQPAASIEQQTPLVREKRHSYVSLMLNQQHRDLRQEKFCTKLLFDSDSESHGHQTQMSCSRNSQQQQQQQQYFNLGGTKSVAFNVVVWLILLMLTFTLPQYSLVTIERILRLSGKDSDALGDRLRANLTILDDLMGAHDDSALDASGYKTAETSDVFSASLRAVSVWFDCICRLLFLLMLPLNGWLYGIRSRSLRTTVTMVLKRYISKKQASIEINQRRKSVVSTRSRESFVCCNSALANQHSCCQSRLLQNCTPEPMIGQQHQHQHQQNEFPDGRVFRRCSSFNLPPQTRQGYYNSIDQANERKTDCDQEQQAHRSHNSSIRFALNDDERHESAADTRESEREPAEARVAFSAPSEARNSLACRLLPLPSLLSTRQPGSQTSSLDSSSLAGSHRSLLSASIRSSRSAALLLLDQRSLPAGGQHWAPTHSQPGASKPAKLTGVLKKRTGSAQMSRQESYESAVSRPSPASISGVLKKTSSSTKSILQQHPHQPASGLSVSFARTQSLDRDNSFDTVPDYGRRALDNAQRTISTSSCVAPNAARQRMRKASAMMAPPPPPPPPPPAPVNSVQTDESKDVGQPGGDDTQEAKLARSRQPVSRRSSSDIKFLLTSAGDQAETKLLLDSSDLQVKAEASEVKAKAIGEVATPTGKDLEETVETEALNLLRDSDKQFEEILLRESPSQRIAYKLDHYKQLKTAISRYFLNLRARRLSSSSGSADELNGNEKRSKYLRQNSDTSHSGRGGPTEAWTSLTANGGAKCNGTDDQQCARCSTTQVAKFSVARGSSRLRRNSLDGNIHKLAILQQLGPQSGLSETVRHAAQASNRAMNKSASNQSISSNGSTKSEQLHNSQHRLQAAQLQQLRHQQQQQQPQSSHLKPPNFLKLVFESDGQAMALYSSSLALSPIKECSSNHSWASSQSSLSTSNANATGQQRKSSAASASESVAKSLLELG